MDASVPIVWLVADYVPLVTSPARYRAPELLHLPGAGRRRCVGCPAEFIPELKPGSSEHVRGGFTERSRFDARENAFAHESADVGCDVAGNGAITCEESELDVVGEGVARQIGTRDQRDLIVGDDRLGVQ